jgi:hypothetical protein
MADFDLQGLLGNMFGGGSDSELEKLLTAKQREQLGLQSTLSAAAALLQAGGRGPQRIGLGQALGSALQAGQGAYEKGTTNAFQQLLLGQKLREGQQELDFNARMREMLTPKPAGGGVVPQTVGRVEAITAPPEVAGPFGPTPTRQALIPPTEMISAQPSAAKTSGMFANLTPEQRAIAAFNPKTMLPKIFEESLKADSFRPMSKEEVTAMGLDPRSVYQLNTRTGEPKLLNKYEGVFGGGLQGNAYDVLLTKEVNTPEYALAYRALSQPVPVEKVQPDGSVKISYEIPMPIPTSFAKPTYGGKLPAAKQAGGAAPSGAQMPTGGAAPTQAAVGPMEVQPGGLQGAGAKSTPYAPTPGQIGDARKQALTIEKLVGSLNALETSIKQEGMQIGGMGKAGGTQEARFQDSILQLKELQNLGVLNGPDERILLQQLANPTQLSSYLKGYGGPDYVYSKITELKDKAQRELQMINRQFPVPVTGQQPIVPAMPQRFAVPPGLGDILKRYPGAGG